MSVTETRTLLDKVSVDASERFNDVAVDVIRLVSEDDANQWAMLCGDLTSLGWHGFEATLAYLTLTQEMLTGDSVERLLDAGRFGCDFSTQTSEPSIAYFEGYAALIIAGRGASYRDIEDVARLVSGRYKRAVTLVADYFRSAYGIAIYCSPRDLAAWLEMAHEFANKDRGMMQSFLQLSSTEMPWLFIHKLARVSESSSITYMQYHDSLQEACSEELLMDLQPLFLKYVASEQLITPFYDALVKARLTGRSATTITGLLQPFEDVRLATALVDNAERLPMDGTIDQWIAEGLDQKSFVAREAFFQLESSRSQELLESLRGQVNLQDYKRVMLLYTEAFCGRRLTIESSLEDDEPCKLPHTDGQTIFLPASVNYFPTHAENFSYLKVALLHQLGLFEFGTFTNIAKSRHLIKSFEKVPLAYYLYNLLEDARVDWQLEHKFRGVRPALLKQKKFSLSLRNAPPDSLVGRLLEVMIQVSLDGIIPDWIDSHVRPEAELLAEEIRQLRLPGATVEDALRILPICYRILENLEMTFAPDSLPDPVIYRGESDTEIVMLNLALVDLNEDFEVDEGDEDSMSMATFLDPKNADIKSLKDGDLQDMAGMLVTELDVDLVPEEGDESEELMSKFKDVLKGFGGQRKEAHRFRYDEWDHLIDDYRRHWCTLHEIRDIDVQPEFVDDTLREYSQVARNVRKQLNMLKPELLRKVKGVVDGEELDLERAVESIVDRRSGITPDERIYIRRERKERDVAALFLLDMSASTDDVIVSEPSETPLVDGEPGYEESNPSEKRIIDLEKESVILMSDALEELGDNYSVCGFSGYGRDQVEYFLCKDFDEPLNHRSKGRIGGIEPCRSTRMGPAIRHATRSLVKTECRVKALIIISDGYPQDFDYGKDRNSKEYGIMDTMKSLTECREQGVQSFCLTVDPSGHDYLRSMCQDSEYMVIQDIKQLPNELSKVYRSLTG